MRRLADNAKDRSTKAMMLRIADELDRRIEQAERFERTSHNQGG
jgi:hypothetical protein